MVDPASGIAVGDEDLDEQRMDLVYSARAGRRRVLIYVLAEHQSKVDPWMAFRLLCYLVAIWKGYRAQHPRARMLPAILPIVVHHSPTGWTAPIAFEELLDVDAELLAAFEPHVPRFRFLLDDLSAQTDADLRARTQMTAGGRVAILSLKHGRDQVAMRIRVLAPDGRSPSARDVLASVLRYILETSRASFSSANASDASPWQPLPGSIRREPPNWTPGPAGCSRLRPSTRCWGRRCRPTRQCSRRVHSLAPLGSARAADCLRVQPAGGTGETDGPPGGSGPRSSAGRIVPRAGLVGAAKGRPPPSPRSRGSTRERSTHDSHDEVAPHRSARARRSVHRL